MPPFNNCAGNKAFNLEAVYCEYFAAEYGDRRCVECFTGYGGYLVRQEFAQETRWHAPSCRHFRRYNLSIYCTTARVIMEKSSQKLDFSKDSL